MSTKTPAQNSIDYNSRRLGFWLFGTENSRAKDIRPEDLILSILRNCTEPRYVEGLPVIIAKNHIDYEYLVQQAIAENRINQVGWALDEARCAFDRTGIKYMPELIRAVDYLYERRTNTPVFVDDADARFDWPLEDLSDLARKWQVLDASPPESMDKNLRTYRCILAR